MNRKKIQYAISILAWGFSSVALGILIIGSILFAISVFYSPLSANNLIILFVFILSFYPWYRLWIMNKHWICNKKLGFKSAIRDLLMGCMLIAAWVIIFQEMNSLFVILAISFPALIFACYLVYWHSKPFKIKINKKSTF